MLEEGTKPRTDFCKALPQLKAVTCRPGQLCKVLDINRFQKWATPLDQGCTSFPTVLTVMKHPQRQLALSVYLTQGAYHLLSRSVVQAKC